MKIKKYLRKFLFVITILNITIVWSQKKSPNIILLIGDGMGLSQITAGMYSNDNNTSLEDFEYIGLSKTASSNKLVTDSAASGTAMASGVKTLNGVIGIDPNNIFQKSILEICQEKGYKTALIATSSIVHATPASFYANEVSRYNYDNIALQLSNHSVDIFVGGGSKHFSKRKDKRNLIKEMSDYDFVKSINEFEKTKASKVGFFTYFGEPPAIIEGRTPNLDKITKIALNKLASKESPFFIMIEGSQIDWGGHDNNSKYVLSEFKEFDSTIREAINFAKNDGNTLVVVTADHETGGMAVMGGKINRIHIEYNTKGHSATMVPVFSYGPGADLFKGIYENTGIFKKLKSTLE